MAKEATIFGRMIFRQRGLLAKVMTGEAGELRLFFAFKREKTVVDLIMGEEGGRFLWGLEKKNENSDTEDRECRINQ